MAKRRTSGIQRRDRASEDALNRRLDQPDGIALPDWRLLAIGGVLVIGVVIIGLVLLLGSGPSEAAGTRQADDGATHIRDGTIFPEGQRPYSSTPGTSGPHWDSPNQWGVYSTPQREEQLIHNLEHGGIVIWYDADALESEDVDTLTQYVNRQTATGISGRYKFILSPWDGPDFGHPIAVTAWRQLLYLDEVDTGAIDEFARTHYGRSPEPGGGPGPPGT
ncbi:MAG TPA: DUF3105 domain-containing protein [Candidatus Limnocylindrales bacterium]|jgi:hypothetical protein|nr:DUF3105 domain-containing protein [Candidatus Limnocylindrales bacterium]